MSELTFARNGHEMAKNYYLSDKLNGFKNDLLKIIFVFVCHTKGAWDVSSLISL